MPRFVALLHETPPDSGRPTHIDLMFEADGVLWTWAVEEMPAVGRTVMAERLTDHRLAYLEYEGKVSGGRGRVRRVERGEYRTIESSPELMVVLLQGEQLAGTLTISRAAKDHRWRVSLSS